MEQFIGIVFIIISVKNGLCLEIPEPIGRVDCKESRIDKNITLIEGRNAGRFLKANKSISNMKQCVAQCCGVGGCDLAFMVNNQCYSVICTSLESCAPKKNTDGKMKTMVAYVAKKYTQKYLEASEEGEPAISDDLEAEYTEENPFLFEGDEDDVTNAETRKLNLGHKEQQVKDLFLAIGCGLIAVMVGVAGVIMMTRKLVEDETRGIDGPGLGFDWTQRNSVSTSLLHLK